MATHGGAGLEEGITVEDPLTLDLIQRLNHQEIDQDPPARLDLTATTIFSKQEMGTKKRRFTRAKKGKNIEGTATMGQPSQGHPSHPIQTAASSGWRRNSLKEGSSSASSECPCLYSPGRYQLTVQ